MVKNKNPENKIIKIDVTNIYEREFANCANETAYCTPYTLLRLLADLVPDIPDKLLYLDGVQDPGNVGTLIRTALAFSYSGVILSKDTASIYNDKVISSTKGAIFSLPIYNDIDLISLKEKGYEIVSTSLKNAIDYKEYHFKNKFVLVLGNEGQGVKEENLLISDYIVKINMDNIDSLNVGVAGGILMNEYR